MTGVVTQTISDYNFNPHYYHDKEDFPNPVIIVKSREHNNKKTVLNVGGERHEVAWSLEDAHVGAPHQTREAYPGQHP